MQKPAVTLMVKAARAAGNVLLRNLSRLDALNVVEKGRQDYASEVDAQAEEAAVRELRRAAPDYAILGEEGGLQGKGRSTWVIDPLDGTTNLVKGIPHFAVSIALRVKGKTEQAVVYDPIRDELFTATRGSGAQLNGYRIRVGKAKELSGTILATGFPFKQKHHIEPYLKMFQSMFIECADIRRAGSASLDLAYVAAGRVDGFWEIGLKPWDTAAGELLAKEAGAIVTDFVGGHNYENSGNIVVANPRVLKEMLGKIRENLPESLAK